MANFKALARIGQAWDRTDSQISANIPIVDRFSCLNDVCLFAAVGSRDALHQPGRYYQTGRYEHDECKIG